MTVKLLRIPKLWCPSMQPAKIEFFHPKTKPNDVNFSQVNVGQFLQLSEIQLCNLAL